MKRALSVATVLAALAFSAFGIGTFSGDWKAGLQLLPSPVALKANKLTINYTDFGWTLMGTLSLLGGEEDTFDLGVKGALGLLSVDGTMNFDFDAAAYLNSTLDMSLDFAGMGLELVIDHSTQTTSYCPRGAPNLKYTLTAKVDPVSAEIVFVDCCSGTAFYSLTFGIKGIGLCCGVSIDTELSFTKANGFEYLKFSGIEIPICCGVSFTAKVTFTTTAKTIETGFKFAGLGDACFTLYAKPNIATDDGWNWKGLFVNGWKIKCTLGDCSYVEFLSAVSPKTVKFLPKKIKAELKDTEFQWVKLGFCGPGCCGGNYKADLAVYFGSEGKLFDITRIAANMAIPVLTNLDASVSFSTALDGKHTLEVGWTFTF